MNEGTDKAVNVTHGQHPAGGNGREKRAHDDPVSHGKPLRSRDRKGFETVPDLLAKFALTDVEVGRLLGVPATTVQNLHRTGALRAVKIGGRCCWRPGDVEAFVERLQQGE